MRLAAPAAGIIDQKSEKPEVVGDAGFNLCDLIGRRGVALFLRQVLRKQNGVSRVIGNVTLALGFV